MADFGIPDLNLDGLFSGSLSWDQLGPLAETAAAGASAVGQGTGGFWSDFGDFASKVGTGIGDFAGGFGKFAQGALPFVQLGTTGLGIASGIRAAEQMADAQRSGEAARGLQTRAAETALSTSAPLKAFGEQSLARAAAGEIPPAARAKIEEWKNGKKAEIRDYLARAGLGDSQSLQMAEAQIDQMSESMVLAEIERQNTLGITALGGAAGAAGTAASSAGLAGVGAGNDEAMLEQLIAQANAQLARVAGARA